MFRALCLCVLALWCSVAGAVIAPTQQWSTTDRGVTYGPAATKAAVCEQARAGWAAVQSFSPGYAATVKVTEVGTNGQCEFSATATGGSPSYYDHASDLVPVNSCPANSTDNGAGGCGCKTGYSESNGSCGAVPSCAFGTPVKSGYFDYGKDPAGAPPALVCAGGCSALFYGDLPAGSSIVDGVKHWYAKGSYQMSGGTCDATDANTPGVPSSSSGIPADACGQNQNQGTVTQNGQTKTVCVDKVPDDPSKAGQAAGTNDPNKPNTSSSTTINITNNNNGTTTTTTTTVTNGGNGTTKTEKTTEVKDADGKTVSKGTETTWSGKQTDAEAQKSKCEENAAAEGCGGNPKDISGSTLYTPKDKTAGGVLTAAKDTILSSPLGSAMGGFFTVSGGGTCTAMHGSVTLFDRAMSIDGDVFCSSFAAQMFLIVRAVVMLLAVWWAWRVAVE